MQPQAPGPKARPAVGCCCPLLTRPQKQKLRDLKASLSAPKATPSTAGLLVVPESGAGLAQLVEPPAGGEPQQPPHHDCFLALIPGLLEVRFWQQLKSLPKAA